MLGLKYAREELILYQMKETQEALAKLSLKGAVEEQKQLLAKLERLQQLLLSTDLDFEMRLERLRQIRETLKKLDHVIKEESREEKLSKKAAAKEKELAELAKRKAALEELVKQQTEHIEEEQAAGKERLRPTTPSARRPRSWAKRRKPTRKSTEELAEAVAGDVGSENLTQAAASMKSGRRGAGQAGRGRGPAADGKGAGGAEERTRGNRQAGGRSQGGPGQGKIRRHAQRSAGQSQHHRRSHRNDPPARQQRPGLASRPDQRQPAAWAMPKARLAARRPAPATANKRRPWRPSSMPRSNWPKRPSDWPDNCAAKCKKRVTDGLTGMLEMQIAVRERTAALGKSVKEGSRQALAAVAVLAKREEKITAMGQELINIVEETEFGIALPAALAAVRDATENVQLSLADGDASTEVVKAEQQIEADLKAMIDVVSRNVRRQQPQRPPRRQLAEEDQRKEQNRIISELKMIRLLEERVHQSTTDVDSKREGSPLSRALRKRIERSGRPPGRYPRRHRATRHRARRGNPAAGMSR